jgi:SagB-type dehydrogenase family enzyme
MPLKFFSFNSSSEDASVVLVDPLSGNKKVCLPESCIEVLERTQENSSSLPEIAAIEHWWNRKWQMSLDYYLVSQAKKENLNRNIAPKPLQKIDIFLPTEKTNEQHSLMQALIERKTHRKFHNSSLSLEIFSTLLLNLREELFKGVWNYYLVIFNVSGIPEGIYQYCPLQHGLTLIRQGNFREELVPLLCGMVASVTASFSMILSVDLEIAHQMLPYERGLREIYIDSGRIAQKLLLKGMQYHLGGLPSPAMRDSPMCEFLQINPNFCMPLYTITMGIIAEKNSSMTSMGNV